MTRWIFAATMIAGLGALGASSATADHKDVERAQRRVHREWRDYNREIQRGHYHHAQREYRDVVKAQYRLNREIARSGYYGGYVGFGATYGTAYCPPAATTAFYSQQPYMASGGVMIWR